MTITTLTITCDWSAGQSALTASTCPGMDDLTRLRRGPRSSTGTTTNYETLRLLQTRLWALLLETLAAPLVTVRTPP